MKFKSKVNKITRLSDDSVAIQFEKPENFNFIPGQFLTARFTLRETEKFKILNNKNPIQQRSYSISSSPTQEYIEITVKEKIGGFISDYITNILEINEEVEINGPFGKFIFDENDKNIVLVAGGSGIAPYMSLIRYVKDKKLPNNIELIYSSKKKDGILWKEEIDNISKENPNIKCFHTLTKEETEHEHFKGRISKDMISKCINLNNKKYYICGSTKMVEDTSSIFLELGVNDSDLKLEKYG